MPALPKMVGLAILLTGCATSTDYLEYRPQDRPQVVADRLLSSIRSCWFGEAEKDFAGLAYEAELSSHSNKPRILVVKADEPGGLPQLIVEASKTRRRTSVKVFGPLLTTPLGPRIRADIDRWTGGRSGCA